MAERGNTTHGQNLDDQNPAPSPDPLATEEGEQ